VEIKGAEITGTADCGKTIVPFFYPPLTTKIRFLGIRDTNYLLFQLYPPLLAVDLVILLVIIQTHGSSDPSL
jgi:hypothetical protein